MNQDYNAMHQHYTKSLEYYLFKRYYNKRTQKKCNIQKKKLSFQEKIKEINPKRYNLIITLALQVLRQPQQQVDY